MADSAPVFNATTALARIRGDVRLFKDLIRFFQEDAPKFLVKIQAAIDSASAVQLMRAAHSLKGLVVNFDAVAATASAQQLELMGLTGDLEHARAELVRLKDLIAELDRELAAYLKAN